MEDRESSEADQETGRTEMTKKKGDKFHHWDPIYDRKILNENTTYLFGICMNCKKVMSGEQLLKRLNRFEELYGGEVKDETVE